MMKLTVAFLASLAAADAAQAHGRRHVRRQYGELPPYSLPGTGYSSATSSVAPSSSPDAATSSEGLPYFPPTGTAVSSYPAESKPPVGTGGMNDLPGYGTEPVIPSSSAAMDNTKGPNPPYVPTGTGYKPTITAYPTGGKPEYPTKDELVTSTVWSTQTFTVTACPKTVSDCPSESTYLVSSTVPVGLTSYAPHPTGVYEVIETSTSEVVHTTTETLTYTVGYGEHAHSTTKEITATSTETLYETCTVTKDASEITGTTTLTTTSTTTRYITVRPTPSKNAYDNEVPKPSGPAGGEEECIAQPPVTVTVTEQNTKTVTIGDEEYPTSSAAVVTEKYPEVPASSEAPVVTATYEAPVVTDVPVPSSSAAMDNERPTSKIYVTVVPYPIGNGTQPQPTGSSGFLTYTKPGGGYGTGAPVPVPSSSTYALDEELPSFTFPGEEVPASTAPVQTEVPKESEYPIPTAVPSDSYGPGYRKRYNF